MHKTATPSFSRRRCGLEGRWDLSVVRIEGVPLHVRFLHKVSPTLSMGHKRHFYKRQNEQLVEN